MPADALEVITCPGHVAHDGVFPGALLTRLQHAALGIRTPRSASPPGGLAPGRGGRHGDAHQRGSPPGPGRAGLARRPSSYGVENVTSSLGAGVLKPPKTAD